MFRDLLFVIFIFKRHREAPPMIWSDRRLRYNSIRRVFFSQFSKLDDSREFPCTFHQWKKVINLVASSFLPFYDLPIF